MISCFFIAQIYDACHFAWVKRTFSMLIGLNHMIFVKLN
uniref:Uncharacterized protein n=1 Tax=Anguilla anguilla TaxID=7936 RepID=A0A0E9XID4_ANGAN